MEWLLQICFPMIYSSVKRWLYISIFFPKIHSKVFRMSLTIQQIITDAKKLAGRLKERDSVANFLLAETHAINKKIDAMKQVYFHLIKR